MRNTLRTQNSGREKDIDLAAPDLKLAFIFIGTGNVSCSLLYFQTGRGSGLGSTKHPLSLHCIATASSDGNASLTLSYILLLLSC